SLLRVSGRMEWITDPFYSAAAAKPRRGGQRVGESRCRSNLNRTGPSYRGAELSWVRLAKEIVDRADFTLFFRRAEQPFPEARLVFGRCRFGVRDEQLRRI